MSKKIKAFSPEPQITATPHGLSSDTLSSLSPLSSSLDNDTHLEPVQTGLERLRVGFLGCGHMGRAILGGLLEAKLVSPERVWIAARSSARETAERYGVHATSPLELFKSCDVILLGIKPQQVSALAPWVEEFERSVEDREDREQSAHRPIVISMLAGTSLEQLRAYLPTSRFALARVMPNLCAQVGHGVTLCCAEPLSRGHKISPDKTSDLPMQPLELCQALFAPLGHVEVLEYEDQLHAATALSGCGPAYLFNIIEALADAAVHQGIKRDVALRLAAHTVWGSGMLATREHPALLKDRVTSPGGVTIEGVRALEQAGMRGAVISAVIAATQRSRELSERSL